MTTDEELRKKLRRMFAEEAEEHLQTMSEGLLVMEKSADPGKEQGPFEAVYRAAHSLKGAARAADFPGIETICQTVESVFFAWKSRDTAPGRSSFDLMFRVIDGIRKILSNPDQEPGLADTLTDQLRPIVEKEPSSHMSQERFEKPRLPPAEERSLGSVKGFRHNTEPVPPELPVEAGVDSAPAVLEARTSSVRIATSKLDAVLLKAEQMLSVKLRTEQYVLKFAEMLGAFADWKKEWAGIGALLPQKRALNQTTGSDAQGGDDPTHLVSAFLDRNALFIKDIETRMEALMEAVAGDRQLFGALIDDLLGDAKNMLMLPFATMLRPFPRMVRDISSKQDKDVELEIRGDTVEVDKRILEALKDPMNHLIRNCIDHGIETPEERVRTGKPRAGTIKVNISQVGGSMVEITVSDDGRGIDLVKVREAAVQNGMVSPEDFDAMNEAQRLAFVFRSGVSTSPIITEVSGRGLGLAIVQEQAEKLGGSVSLEASTGNGTTFRFRLPLTLATFRAVIVECAGRLFAVPTASIGHVSRIATDDIQTMENRESVVLNGKPLALVRLDDLLGLPRTAGEEKRGNSARMEMRKPSSRRLPIVVLKATGKEIAFVIDSVRTEQEILVKGLGPQLVGVRNIAGATVLGSGQVVPILNVRVLVATAVKSGGAKPASIASVQEVPEARNVLVAEDSITSRTLLRSILESAGYSVTTAVDGVDAMTALKTGNFCAVVSDVEMPRMDGIELTQCIRREARFENLPVVLVTARESRADRERGVEAGANAYIMKSSFDQSNLIEALGRLV